MLGYMPGTSGTSPAVLRADSDLFTYSRTFCSTCLTRHLSVCLEPGTFPLGQAWRARRYVCTGTRARETDCCSVHPRSSTSEEFGPFSCRAIAKFTPKRSHFFFCPPTFKLPSRRLGDGQEKGDIVLPSASRLCSCLSHACLHMLKIFSPLLKKILCPRSGAS